MTQLQVPDFTSYEDEAKFWDELDTRDLLRDDGEWFHFETPLPRAMRIAILPEVVSELARRASVQGVSVETLTNAWLIEHLHESAVSPG